MLWCVPPLYANVKGSPHPICWSPTEQRGQTLGQDVTSFCHVINKTGSPLQSLSIVSFHPPRCRSQQNLLRSASLHHHTSIFNSQQTSANAPCKARALPRCRKTHTWMLTVVKTNVFLHPSSGTSRPMRLRCNSTELHYCRLKLAHLFNVAA